VRRVRPASLEIYKGRGGDWRWRVKAQNGHNQANGSEGYRNRRDLLEALLSVRDSLMRTEHLPPVAAGPQAGSAERVADGISAPTPAADAGPDASPASESTAPPRRRRGFIPRHFPSGQSPHRE
jgi:uncharacterized protein YegP (UPF0339 family)